MDKELKCPSCGAALHLVDDVELQVVSSAAPEAEKAPVAPVEVTVAPEVAPEAAA